MKILLDIMAAKFPNVNCTRKGFEMTNLEMIQENFCSFIITI